MKIHIKKSFLLLLVVSLVLSLALSGCGGNGNEDNGEEPAKPTIAYYATNSEPILDWDPAVMFSNGIIVLNNIYETLLRYDAVNDEIIPVLAESYSKSDDSLVWTFKIREGIKFHDGTDLNAEAVKYSIDRTMRINKGASYIWMAVKEINAKDDYTVEFVLNYPAPMDLIASTGYAAFIYSPTSVTSDDSDWFSDGKECGTGPYMLQSQVPGDEVILTKYEEYWNGWEGNHFDKVVIKKVTETSSRRQMIEKGEADVTINLPYEDVEAIKDNENVMIDLENSFINVASYFNTQKAPLDNKTVRQALSYAFPYDDVVEFVLGGYATQGRGPIPEGLWGHGADLKQYTHDLEKAKELLAEAGYADGGFEFLYTYMSGDEEEKKTAELYKSELAKIGVELEIRGMPWDSQWEMAKGAAEGRQDMMVMYWWPDYPSPVSWLYNLYHSEEEPLFNLGYYSNAQVDTLIEEADQKSADDIDAAKDLFIQAQEIIVDEAPAIFQYDKVNVWVRNASFEGHVGNPAYPNVVFFYDTYRAE